MTPQQRFYTLRQVLAMLPISKSTLLEGAKVGRFPRPVKLGGRNNYWKVDEIESLLKSL